MFASLSEFAQYVERQECLGNKWQKYSYNNDKKITYSRNATAVSFDAETGQMIYCSNHETIPRKVACS